MAQWYQAVHASKRYRLGSEKSDITGAKFVYGKGVASNTVGAFVLFNDGTFTPVLMVSTPLTGSVGISAAANTSATSFSWYMVKGSTVGTALAGLAQIATGSTDKAPLSQGATPGLAVGTGVVATKTITGAFAIGVSAANLGNAFLNYPSTAGGSLA